MPPDASPATEKKGKANGTDAKGKAGYSQKTGSYLPDIHRTLPHSTDAEQGVLGSMLISPNEVIGHCVEQITEKHFHVPAHATIYEVLVELWNAKASAIDFITLTQVLKDRKLLDQVGGPLFVTNLFTFVPTAANVNYYLEIVREKFILRQIIGSCTECVGRAYDDQDEVQNLLDEVEQKIFAITEDRAKGKLPTIKEQVMEAVDSIEKLYERKGAISGVPTGFAELDSMTDGMHAAEMIVIAARPSMGKTALAMNIAEYVAVNMQQAVAVFSLEMSAQQLIQRLICSQARISLKKIKDGFLSERDFPKLTEAASKFANSKMIIDDTAGLSILEFRAKARRLKAQHNIQLIVIDYLQLLRSTSRRAQDNRQLEIAEISAGIKALAKELKLPIIVLAQLNRNPENRTGESKGRPRLSDLRESGSIEQDADLVGLLVREEYYADTDEDKQESEGKATLIIAKQRNGPTGDVPLTFLKEFTRFEDRARDVGHEP
ncbi:MAG: replicative DNA helicase [Verrucomicrobiota bacterium]